MWTRETRRVSESVISIRSFTVNGTTFIALLATPLCHNWNMSHSFFHCPSLIDRRGFVPLEDVVYAGPTEIRLPAAKNDINMVGCVSVWGHAPLPISSPLTFQQSPLHIQSCSPAWLITCLPPNQASPPSLDESEESTFCLVCCLLACETLLLLKMNIKGMSLDARFILLVLT